MHMFTHNTPEYDPDLCRIMLITVSECQTIHYSQVDLSVVCWNHDNGSEYQE